MQKGDTEPPEQLEHNADLDIIDFPETEQIFLEENYRSTGAILAISHAIVSQGEFQQTTLIQMTD